MRDKWRVESMLPRSFTLARDHSTAAAPLRNKRANQHDLPSSDQGLPANTDTPPPPDTRILGQKTVSACIRRRLFVLCRTHDPSNLVYRHPNASASTRLNAPSSEHLHASRWEKAAIPHVSIIEDTTVVPTNQAFAHNTSEVCVSMDGQRTKSRKTEGKKGKTAALISPEVVRGRSMSTIGPSEGLCGLLPHEGSARFSTPTWQRSSRGPSTSPPRLSEPPSGMRSSRQSFAVAASIVSVFCDTLTG